MIGKLLGIDHGLKRIGVAVSDALGISARELAILDNGDQTLADLQATIEEQQIVAIVVGIPSNEGNTEQADAVQAWIAAIKPHIGVPIVMWDEQLSSADAKALARQIKRKPTSPIDDLAAKVILQSYLNALADGLATLPTD